MDEEQKAQVKEVQDKVNAIKVIKIADKEIPIQNIPPLPFGLKKKLKKELGVKSDSELDFQDDETITKFVVAGLQLVDKSFTEEEITMGLCQGEVMAVFKAIMRVDRNF